MKFRNKKLNQNIKFKSAKIEQNSKKFIPSFIPIKRYLSAIIIAIIILISITILIKFFIKKIFIKDKLEISYSNYERKIITEEMLQKAEWDLPNEEAFIINGIIRKHKPKKCLEIGVGKGGTSVLILNAIKDISDSSLISIDIHHKVINDVGKNIGYKVEKHFSSLSPKWQLFLGDMPHIILEKLNLKFNFVILDTSRTIPGEILNFIEVLPFLEDNALIVLPNLIKNLNNSNYIKENNINLKTTSTSIFLMSSVVGVKKIFYNENKVMENIGLIMLEKNQEKFYENYFLMLLNIWENMLTDEEIFQLRLFIEKFYKKEKYINIFENAVLYNKNYQKILQNFKT